MATMLNCIERTPGVLEGILRNRKENAFGLLHSLNRSADSIDEIVFVGSGTSNTSAITARSFVESYAGIRATCYVPNDFFHGIGSLNPHALYVFTSQTGTSVETRGAMEAIRKLGLPCVGITESAETPLAKACPYHWEMGCGSEEYPMRTVGYSASVLSQMLLGLELGLIRQTVDRNRYETLIGEASCLPESIADIIPRALAWAEGSKWRILRSSCLIFAGADSLYGVALEAALKTWEILQKPSCGYELEESLHGPNYGYDATHCVIVLNDGGRESRKALALGRYVEEVVGNGFVIGSETAHERDLRLSLKGGAFSALELMVAAQTVLYRLTVDCGRDLDAPQHHEEMERYFVTHREETI